MLALKRFLRPGKLLLFLLISLAVIGGRAMGREASLRPCGILCQDDSGTALAVKEELLRHGFLAYEDLEDMTEDISMGVLDCGAVLLPGIGEAIEGADYAGFVRLLAAPDAFLTEVYEAHIIAALYTAAAPAMVEQAAEQAGVVLTLEDIREEWQRLLDGGYRFTFQVVTVEGVPPEKPDYGRLIAQAAGALLLFSAVVPGTVRLTADADRLWNRIGRRKALWNVLLPGLFWQAVFCSLAVAPWLGRDGWAVPGYVLALTALGLLIARLPVSLKPLLPLVLLGALALMPIYYDLTALYPSLLLLRKLLPPCWLLELGSYPALGAAIGAAATAAILALYPKRRQV